MKHIKMYEAWSAKFNRTLQGASAIATATNKGFGKAAKAIKDYAERSISKEKFSLKLENGDDITFTHDPDFLIKPISEFLKFNVNFAKENKQSDQKDRQENQRKRGYFMIPLKLQSASAPLANKLFTMERSGSSLILMFGTPDGSLSGTTTESSSLVFGPFQGGKEDYNVVRFSDRSGIENFLAMAIQAITSSPEPGTPVDFSMTKEWIARQLLISAKQDILALIQEVVLDKDMRKFTM